MVNRYWFLGSRGLWLKLHIHIAMFNKGAYRKAGEILWGLINQHISEFKQGHVHQNNQSQRDLRLRMKWLEKWRGWRDTDYEKGASSGQRRGQCFQAETGAERWLLPVTCCQHMPFHSSGTFSHHPSPPLSLWAFRFWLSWHLCREPFTATKSNILSNAWVAGRGHTSYWRRWFPASLAPCHLHTPSAQARAAFTFYSWIRLWVMKNSNIHGFKCTQSGSISPSPEESCLGSWDESRHIMTYHVPPPGMTPHT